MEFLPLFSGSKGNASLVRGGGACVLVDAGVSCRTLENRLFSLGISPDALSGICLTHEHGDHVQGVRVFCRRHAVPVFATAGTWAGMGRQAGEIAPFNRIEILPEQDFYIGGLDVLPFSIPHDANQPVGFSFSAGGVTAAVATDMGRITPRVLDHLREAEMLLLESNHDERMLKSGPYPPSLQRRILGPNGHLSNDVCAAALVELGRDGRSRDVFLGHLSETNNTPELAYQTSLDALGREDMRPGRDLNLWIACPA